MNIFHEDRLLIDGELLRGESSFSTINPATGQVLGLFQRADGLFERGIDHDLTSTGAASR